MTDLNNFCCEWFREGSEDVDVGGGSDCRAGAGSRRRFVLLWGPSGLGDPPGDVVQVSGGRLQKEKNDDRQPKQSSMQSLKNRPSMTSSNPNFPKRAWRH